MAIVDISGKWIKVNRSLCDMVGYSENELLDLSFQDITHPDDLEDDLDNVKKLLNKTKTSYQLEKRYIKKSAEVLHAILSVSMICKSDGTPQFFISQIQDITDRKKYESELLRLVSEDFLTKIGNRRFFYEQATWMIKMSGRSKELLTLLLVDIDHFKNVNDSYGHDVGDTVLQKVADICKESARATDVIGRIGGEEFAILLVNTGYKENQLTAERLRSKIENTPIESRGNKLHITISIGAVTFAGDLKSIDFRLRQADDALYRAKKLGRNRVEFIADHTITSILPKKLHKKDLIHLQWSHQYESGNQTIDSQHHHLFQLSNWLLSAIIDGETKENCVRLIDTITNSVKNHFQDEAEIFTLAKYEGAKEHSKIHGDLLDQCIEFADKYKHNSLSLGEIFVFLAREVIYNHMIIEDKKFFKCL